MLEDPLRQDVVGELFPRCIFDGSEQRASQEEDLNEVVEVTGLQGGVLSIVGEAEKLLSFFGQAIGFAQVA
jgi:hypothetical protein